MRKVSKKATRETRKPPRPGGKAQVPDNATDRWRLISQAILFAMTLLCYWTPMTSSSTSILWDAADFFQSIQNYLSTELHAGRIPFWSPYPACGYPFLADPQVGAGYPLNWPFFLAGVAPHLLVVEHWLHSVWACLGAYFLAWRWLRRREAAVFVGLCYGLSGFYVGHSSHTPMLQGAAWMPWIALLLDFALESHSLRYISLAGLAAGMLILSGHFQTILYSFAALGLFSLARVVLEPQRWLKILGMALAIPIIGTGISAISTGPGLELTLNSIRTGVSASSRTEGMIPFGALATLVSPDHFGVLSGNYTGPQDITQYYFYAGILLAPFAILGLRDRRSRVLGLMLIIPTIWYALGQWAGFYRLVALLPGFSSIRAPVHIWFVPSLGLALLAGAGFKVVVKRWPISWLPAACLAFLCADLFYHQSLTNPLAYARQSYQDLYGSKEQLFRKAVADNLPPLTRFDGAEGLSSFGPLAHYLDERAEVTYAYNPLALSRYGAYLAAMFSNPALRKDLNVSRWLDRSTGDLRIIPDPLPRANFPKQVLAASDREIRENLVSLDPTRQALVPAAAQIVNQDANGVADVREFTPGHYRIHYRSATRSLLRVSNAYFPGWTAKLKGQELPVVPADYALIGVIVPAGEDDLVLDYHSRFFVPGALVTLASLGLCAGLLLWSERGTKSRTGEPS